MQQSAADDCGQNVPILFAHKDYLHDNIVCFSASCLNKAGVEELVLNA